MLKPGGDGPVSAQLRNRERRRGGGAWTGPFWKGGNWARETKIKWCQQSSLKGETSLAEHKNRRENGRSGKPVTGIKKTVQQSAKATGRPR